MHVTSVCIDGCFHEARTSQLFSCNFFVMITLESSLYLFVILYYFNLTWSAWHAGITYTNKRHCCFYCIFRTANQNNSCHHIAWEALLDMSMFLKEIQYLFVVEVVFCCECKHSVHRTCQISIEKSLIKEKTAGVWG